MFKNIDTFLFDMDGTLIDSMWLWKSVDVDYLAGFGIPYPEGLQEDIEGRSFDEIAVYMKKRFNIPDSLDKMISDWNRMAYDKYRYEVPMKEGALEFLSLLKEKGYKTGIATSNSKELVDAVDKNHSFSRYIDTMVVSGDVKNGKPAPDSYLELARRLNSKPENCIVFEDIAPGILAGKNAGMRVCAMDDLYSVQAVEEKKELADYFAKSFKDFLECL